MLTHDRRLKLTQHRCRLVPVVHRGPARRRVPARGWRSDARGVFLWTHRCKFWTADDEAQARFLKRQLSLPVSTMSQWWVRRSSSAVVIFGSPNTLGHSAEGEIGGDQK